MFYINLKTLNFIFNYINEINNNFYHIILRLINIYPNFDNFIIHF